MTLWTCIACSFVAAASSLLLQWVAANVSYVAKETNRRTVTRAYRLTANDLNELASNRQDFTSDQRKWNNTAHHHLWSWLHPKGWRRSQKLHNRIHPEMPWDPVRRAVADNNRKVKHLLSSIACPCCLSTVDNEQSCLFS